MYRIRREFTARGIDAARLANITTYAIAAESIEWFLRHPQQGATTAPVLAGHYALREDDGSVKFFRVDRPDSGKWAGYTFAWVQAGDNYHRVKGAAARKAVLARIAADPRAALALYGREVGACGLCSKTLTNDESREFGIGPDCRKKL
ncbi:hypothetical protein GS504_01415 [Rhodococcus hoagii]|nr:hypothetical protein [Prescottella equi]NKS71668.1 hypothetical protein [Prescottella equi]